MTFKHIPTAEAIEAPLMHLPPQSVNPILVSSCLSSGRFHSNQQCSETKIKPLYEIWIPDFYFIYSLVLQWLAQVLLSLLEGIQIKQRLTFGELAGVGTGITNASTIGWYVHICFYWVSSNTITIIAGNGGDARASAYTDITTITLTRQEPVTSPRAASLCAASERVWRLVSLMHAPSVQQWLELKRPAYPLVPQLRDCGFMCWVFDDRSFIIPDAFLMIHEYKQTFMCWLWLR